MAAARPTCSVVVPVRNDGRALRCCLEALERQTIAADEVIVVDNGSSDESVSVARERGVVLLHEGRVGIAAAAAHGYDAARSDLILRLDADSVPPPDWIERVVDRFAREPGLDALSGPGEFTAVPERLRQATTGWYWRFYFERLRRRVGAAPLFGSNLAVRAAAWRQVSDSVHRDDAGVHDDLDLSIHLVEAGSRLALDPGLRMPVSARPLLHPVGMLRRAQRAAHTLALHADPPRSTLRWVLTEGRRRVPLLDRPTDRTTRREVPPDGPTDPLAARPDPAGHRSAAQPEGS
jgi:cellulose synthase/poly-beta-1,6-N-acetylglucosamine synthase-like glycosyltransferase